jgi:hypothetical protein
MGIFGVCRKNDTLIIQWVMKLAFLVLQSNGESAELDCKIGQHACSARAQALINLRVCDAVS